MKNLEITTDNTLPRAFAMRLKEARKAKATYDEAVAKLHAEVAKAMKEKDYDLLRDMSREVLRVSYESARRIEEFLLRNNQ